MKVIFIFFRKIFAAILTFALPTLDETTLHKLPIIEHELCLVLFNIKYDFYANINYDFKKIKQINNNDSL